MCWKMFHSLQQWFQVTRVVTYVPSCRSALTKLVGTCTSNPCPLRERYQSTKSSQSGDGETFLTRLLEIAESMDQLLLMIVFDSGIGGRVDRFMDQGHEGVASSAFTGI